MEHTMPITVILREILGLVETAKQARDVLHNQTVLLNGKRIHDVDTAVGFMDVVEVGGKHYRMLINQNNKLIIVPAGKEDFTIQKISNKTTLSKGVVQLNCTSGLNLRVEKDSYKTGDSIAVGFDGKISAHYSLAVGATVIFTGGNHIGKVGKVEKIEGNTIIVSVNGEHLETATVHAYVVGKDKPAISLN
jgi:small subunit ribosomal protein S4e